MHHRLGRRFTVAVGVAAFSLLTPALFVPAGASEFPNDERTIVHVLNRMAFGPRPGDVERVRRLGVREYIEQQLHSERIDDGALAGRLSELTTIDLTSRQISTRFEQPVLELRRRRNQEGAKPDDPPTRSPELMELQRQANNVLVELSEQKILRAAFSERQLQEVLTDFWFNHFNVDVRKGRDRFFVTEYEREAIRPHVFGRFRDLLEATAKSPAMLFYLDNWMSVDPDGPHPDARPLFVRPPARPRAGRFPPMPRPNPRPAARPNAPRGLNENYGRELMELHTLGVDGGYTQKDVTEVARAFTGWTIENPRQGGGFKFEPRMHDEGEKVVLGHRIKGGGGERDGEQVLDILAKQPATARFIATKLARRFVSDTPPPALIDRVATRFRQTDGDLREVMRTLLTSPEFLSSANYRAKVKTPFEFIVSAVRATGADVEDARPLVRASQQLGMPLYQCQPPTGYKDTADAWTNTGALVNRMNVALALARNNMPGVRVASEQASNDRDAFISLVLGPDVSETTRATIGKATMPPQMVALTLGSPEFQRR